MSDNLEKWLHWQIDKAIDIKKSEVFVAFMTDDYLKEMRCALEIGLAIFFEKPLGFLVKKGNTLPAKLLKFADAIEEYAGPDDVGLASERLFYKLNKIKK